MSNFIPKKGDLFYYESKSFVEDETEVIVNRQVKTLQKITHFMGYSSINECIATDDYIVVGVIVSNSNNEDSVGSKRTFIKNRQNFYPVGPEVKEALGLLEGPEEIVIPVKEEQV